jgi:hypothetical protein
MSGVLFGVGSFAQLESSLRTGDVILYSDAPATFATRRSQRLLRRAAALARFLSFLPCVTHENLKVSDGDGGDGTDEEEHEREGGQKCLLDFEGEFDETRQAAFVIELVDETHTNPRNQPTKLLPYVFAPSLRTITPARDFVAALRGSEPRFALRRLSIAHEHDAQRIANTQRIRTVLGQRLFNHCA